MTIFFVVLGLVISIVVAFIIYRLIAVRIATSNARAKEIDRMQPLLNSLKKGIATREEVYHYARNLITRASTLQAVLLFNRIDLFPEEYNTIEKTAESYLYCWLNFPTELGAYPDEIEYVKKITFSVRQNNFHYHVFRFKSYDPHWAAKIGWNFGVVGPYFDDSSASFNGSAFSRIGKTDDKVTPEEEAAWVHNNLTIRHFKGFEIQ